MIPPADPVFTAGTGIAMNRAVRDPVANTVVNTTAGYLDLSQLYGPTAAAAASLENSDGTLLSSDNGLCLPVAAGQFYSGDPRVTENPELTALTHPLPPREHNYWVGYLRAANPSWTGDQLYQMARAITTAEYQTIVYHEYLPLLLGPVIPAYAGYNPAVNAQVASQEFSGAAFRVGHSQVSDTEEEAWPTTAAWSSRSRSPRRSSTRRESSRPMASIPWCGRSAPTSPRRLTSMPVRPSCATSSLRPLVGGDIDQMDLIAIDIQRERDLGARQPQPDSPGARPRPLRLLRPAHARLPSSNPTWERPTVTSAASTCSSAAWPSRTLPAPSSAPPSRPSSPGNSRPSATETASFG